MDQDCLIDRDNLLHALELLDSDHPQTVSDGLPDTLPESGRGARSALDLLAPIVFGGAARLGGVRAFAHMDPPTPWMTWATTLWNASLNQNLLHPATAPVARELEQRVVQWLAGFLGMAGGHMTPGSTLANLTAIWAALECAGITEVIASENSHLSIAKAAHLLGLSFRTIPTAGSGALLSDSVTGDLSRSVLVLTAGTTSTGAIDPLSLVGRAAWTHVDAAWGGPLCLTRHSSRLAGIEGAHSVSVSAHKLLFQPKESAVVMFRNATAAHSSISFGGAYLAVPNVGVLGSHGAIGVPLLRRDQR
jgi:L-2,4-diaminobutyrate decarboxylase